jgi:serine/threonine protein kinase
MDSSVDLLTSIGVGAYGHVWRGRAPRNVVTWGAYAGSDVAVKASTSSSSSSLSSPPTLLPEFPLSTLRELKALTALSHPNLVELLGASTSTLVFPLADLDLARAVAAPESPLPLPRIRSLVRQLASALAFMHAARFVHRDLKPTNILLTAPGGEEERVRICDFGLSCEFEPSVVYPPPPPPPAGGGGGGAPRRPPGV